jgi:multiple antibiotic resistance protein
MVLAGQAGSTTDKLAVYGAILVTMALSWIVLRLGERVVRRMGETGIRVMTRIMGLLLASVAVQFVMTGARNALHGSS